ncbi:MAG: HAD family hydrolase [Deltaproteobacteria bacterium]|nr:HAD family hydrolase [Deltaproteobacteria bacterium]
MTAINFNAQLDPVAMDKVKSIVQASGERCVAYFDIDGTLVNDDNEPNVHVLSLLTYLHARQCRIYLWSAGGDDNCRKVAERYGIASLVSAYLPKPVISVDDMRYDDYVFLKLHPRDLEPKG